MKVHSVISSSISEDILRTGHLSIRFMADGFSLLLENNKYQPIVLNHFLDTENHSLSIHVQECREWLERQSIIDQFKGECTIVFDSPTFCLVPGELFIPAEQRSFLKNCAESKENNPIRHKYIKGRNLVQVYEIPYLLDQLAKEIASDCRIFHSATVLYSLIDQVNAADHQRGFGLIDIQEKNLTMTFIKNDKVHFSNGVSLNDKSESVYAILNTISHINFDRKTTPLYLCGMIKNKQEEIAILKKYVARIEELPFYMPDLAREFVMEHTLLSEASRCE